MNFQRPGGEGHGALKFNNYKRFMRVSYALYMLATLLGIAVYLTWFVGNPNPAVYQ